jgi:2,3-bisphosphoglycerate-independent phosphoglycerate mutase
LVNSQSFSGKQKLLKISNITCVTGDHSTPVEYGDHSFEPVPFSLCRLEDFVGAIGKDNVNAISLEDFSLPSVAAGDDLAEAGEIVAGKSNSGNLVSCCGDSVSEFSEVAAARGYLGRFPGSEMMGVIKKYMKQKNE